MALAEKLKRLPDKPGIYMMKNEAGEVLYVGKAVSLKNRVRSYFRSSRHPDPKTANLVNQIADFDYILTDSEVEALILECNLIKKHRPRYNVRLMDDKSYPYLKVTLDEKYPRVFMTRRVIRDGARYYGPYTDVGAVRETLSLLKSIFPLRMCRQKSVAGQKRPCLNYHIKRCLAPCTGKVDAESYSDMIKDVCLFLGGKQEDLVKQLTGKMDEASANLDFERAAALRDRIKAVEKVVEKQKIVSLDAADQDVMAMFREGEVSCVVVFFIRGGKLLGREHFILEETSGMDDSEVLTAFVKQYYNQAEHVPGEILLAADLTELTVITTWLERRRGGRVRFRVPVRGEKAKLLKMAAKNAAEELAQHRAREEQAKARIEGALLGLREFLHLNQPPRRIECYDISNIQGAESVGSMVVFVDGKPRNDRYRRFRIKTVEGPNDFASMQEVIRRRFSRALKETAAIGEGRLDKAKAKFAELPSLVIIDGGKGQLSAAREAMRELGFDPIATFGLAKEHEYLYGEGSPDPIVLPRNSESLYLIQRIRDEAHRFAVAYHRNLRGKRSLKSILDDIPGVGPKRRKALVEHFRTMAALRKATVDDLAEVPGITGAVADAVYEFFQQEE
ncbi:MAG: excinuclease ABC subunit C [Firmicutes bacterium HGW-Firmicutes-8]|nr:MAG: excinuclease ABC subunit C [Firmicutes bacterium HGW-Firmicutes-8]